MERTPAASRICSFPPRRPLCISMRDSLQAMSLLNSSFVSNMIPRASQKDIQENPGYRVKRKGKNPVWGLKYAIFFRKLSWRIFPSQLPPQVDGFSCSISADAWTNDVEKKAETLRFTNPFGEFMMNVMCQKMLGNPAPYWAGKSSRGPWFVIGLYGWTAMNLRNCQKPSGFDAKSLCLLRVIRIIWEKTF